jgi:hypothetical protein
MPDATLWLPLLSRALVVGVFGGAGLVLTLIYSRRGPLIYPVYAAILAGLALVSGRFGTLTYTARFAATLGGMLLATAMLLVAVLVVGARQRREIRESGRPFAPGRVPAWGFPLLLLILVVASAGAAYVAS